MYVDTIIQILQASNILDKVYAKSVILEGKLSSAYMQAAVGNNYENIKSAYVNFRNFLKNFANNKNVY